MHTPFAGGEVVRERPFLFFVFLRRASEGLLHVTGGGAEFRAIIEVVDEPVLIAKLIVLSHGGKPFEGQIILVIELSPKALALIGELTHLDGYAPVMVGTGKVKRAVLVPDLLNLAVGENVALTETGWRAIGGGIEVLVDGDAGGRAVPAPNTSRHEDVVAAVRVDEIRHVGLLPFKEGGKCPHLLLVIEIFHLHLMIENLIVGEVLAHLILGQTVTFHEVVYRHFFAFVSVVEVFVEDDALFRFRFHRVSFQQKTGGALPSPVSMHISNGCRCLQAAAHLYRPFPGHSFPGRYHQAHPCRFPYRALRCQRKPLPGRYRILQALSSSHSRRPHQSPSHKPREPFPRSSRRGSRAPRYHRCPV